MSALTLGQSVTITDYLVRGELYAEQVLALSEEWAYLPTIITDKARMAVRRNSGAYSHRFRLWLPASIQHNSYRWGTGWISTRRRHHPAPHFTEMTFPLSGIVTQKVQVQDGQVVNDYEEGNTFVPWSVGVGYRVAYRLSRRSLLVIPSMIEAAA